MRKYRVSCSRRLTMAAHLSRKLVTVSLIAAALAAGANTYYADPVAGTAPLTVSFTGVADGSDHVGLRYRWIFDDGATSHWSSVSDATHTYEARLAPYRAALQVTNAAGEFATFDLPDPIFAYPATAYVATNGQHIAPFDTWDNAAAGTGGAIHAATSATLINNSRFFHNSAGKSGGAIYSDTATIRGNLLGGNEAATHGSAIHARSTTAMANNTVVGNRAGQSSGGVYQSGGTATNMIVYLNELADGAPGDLGGSVTNYGHSLSSDLPDGVDGNINRDPLFKKNGSGAGQGWVPGNYRLRFESPAAGAGTAAEWMLESVDLDGLPRILAGNPNMGAYETLLRPAGTTILIR